MSSTGIDAIEALGVLAGEVIVFKFCAGEVSGEAAAGDAHARAAVGSGLRDGDEQRLKRCPAVVADGQGDGVGGEWRAEGVAVAGEDGGIRGGERYKRKNYERRKLF